MAIQKIEKIPDKDRVFRRVHNTWLTPNGISPYAFKDGPSGDVEVSVDWEKYSTAKDSRSRARKPRKNGVLSLKAGKVRAETNQAVKHKPSRKNRAHSLIYGEKDEEILIKLIRISEKKIPVPQK